MLNRLTARKLFDLWNRVRSTYWFIPTALIAGGFGLSYLMLALDAALPAKTVNHMSFVYTRDPSGARAMLSVISQSVITVAGVVFSVTVVALTMASNQFGTRVLKSFARDTANQAVLGTLLGTFLYGVLVMRRVESDHSLFVPSFSVAAAVFLAVLCVMVLVYFIHHLIVEIQGENVVASVAHDLRTTMETVFPEELGTGAPPKEDSLGAFEANLIAAPGEKIYWEREGFVRSVDSDKLLHLACREDLLVRLALTPGNFVSQYSVLAEVWRGPRNDDACRELRRIVSIGSQRSYEDDIKFGLQQLASLSFDLCVRWCSVHWSRDGSFARSLGVGPVSLLAFRRLFYLFYMDAVALAIKGARNLHFLVFVFCRLVLIVKLVLMVPVPQHVGVLAADNRSGEGVGCSAFAVCRSGAAVVGSRHFGLLFRIRGKSWRRRRSGAGGSLPRRIARLCLLRLSKG